MAAQTITQTPGGSGTFHMKPREIRDMPALFLCKRLRGEEATRTANARRTERETTPASGLIPVREGRPERVRRRNGAALSGRGPPPSSGGLGPQRASALRRASGLDDVDVDR